MRPALRLLAGVKPQYLKPGSRVGLAGVYTHSTPRSTLLYLYATTLEKLQAVPETSVYRQSVEALTKHRQSIVQAVKPEGYDAWRERTQKLVEANPKQFGKVAQKNIDGSATWKVERDGRKFVVQMLAPAADVRYQEWDGEVDEGPEREGIKSFEERSDLALSGSRVPLEEHASVDLEDEPQLTADQIVDIENKIGGGLIEEVIEVAEKEAKLVDVMLQAKPWEPLEEKPAEGQWTYFERHN